MKKLLTMMVSCASALFAMAGDTLSTAKVEFTNYGGVQPNGAAVSLDITKDDALGEGPKYWYSASALANGGIAEAIVTNNGANAYLMLDTSDVLERTIKPWTQGETLNFVPQAIGNGIYFDSMVQFTATEDDVTPTTGDKLVVWLKAVETEMNGEEVVTPGYTNLMITAGNGTKDDKAVPADFVASGVTIEPNSWHQLTIKAFVDEEGDTLFNVYIDGAPVTGYFGEKSVTDFESLVSQAEEGLNPTTITSVGFKGTGAVDDLLFTNANPLGQDVTINLDDVEEYCGKIVYGEDVLDRTQSPLKINVPAGTTEVTLKCYLDPGAVLVDGTKLENDVDGNNVAWTWSGPITDNTITLTVQAAPEPETGAFTIDGVEGSYATLAEAFAAAQAGDTIKLTADATFTEWLKVDKNVVLDLNGCTLTEQVNPDGADYGAIYVRTTCQLTITDSSENTNGKIVSNGDIVIGNYGTVIVNAGTIESGDDREKDVSIYNMNYAGTQIGTATINGGAVESVWNCGTVTVEAGASVTYLDNSGKATIDADATVTTVVLMDGADAKGVTGAGTITAPDGLAVKSGVEGFTATYNDGVWSLVEDSDEPVPEVPTIGDTEVKFDETDVITNITTAANGMNVAGVADINAFLGKFEDCYTVSVVDGKLNIAIDEVAAKPVIGEADLDGDDAEEPAVQIVDGKFKVTIQDSFKSLKYKLQYKAGLGNDPATDKPYAWTDVATEEFGTKGGAMQLSAPANGDKGFYRVVVTE